MSTLNKLIDQISIDEKYCGPPDTANGGYLAGKLAGYFDSSGSGSTINVSLRAATPLDKALNIIEAASDSGKTLQLMDGEKLLAIASEADMHIAKPRLPTVKNIAAARMQCAGYVNHPFPHCFVCGPKRPLGDGLAIYPGPLVNETLGAMSTCVASEWVLTADLKDSQGCVKQEFIWAALDCISAFAILEDPDNQGLVPMVLGKLSASIKAALTRDKAYVMAWPLKREGRKAFANSAVFNQQQECIAVGQALWVSLNKTI